MIKVLNLAKVLKEIGLRVESNLVKDLLKLGAPLVDFVPLSSNEPIGYPTEEDEDGNPIEKEVEKVERRKGILRDQSQRGLLYNEEEDLNNWFESIKCLGDNIFLIPFDRTDVNRNGSVLDGIGAIFGNYNPKNYVSLKEKINIIANPDSYGDLGTLKEVFPSLWNDIKAKLDSKGLDESDVAYVLYNQETNPGRLAGFQKEPFYFAHDLGHADFDSADGNLDFKDIIQSFMKEIGSLYITDEEEDEEEEIEEEEEDPYENYPGLRNSLKKNKNSAYSEFFRKHERDEDYIQNYFSDFFNTTSGEGDLYGDIFAEATHGRLEIEVPGKLYLDRTYHLPEDKVSEANKIVEKTKRKLMEHIGSDYEGKTLHKGPFSHWKGSVILYDIL
jgi:hypothetical protein